MGELWLRRYQSGMNLASGVAVYKARKIQIHKKTFPANVSAHPTQPGAREE